MGAADERPVQRHQLTQQLRNRDADLLHRFRLRLGAAADISISDTTTVLSGACGGGRRPSHLRQPAGVRAAAPGVGGCLLKLDLQ